MLAIKGIGVDIVQNIRIQAIIQRSPSHLNRFLQKVLHLQEIEQFHQKGHLTLQTQYLSSRWAYKEAMVKASGDKTLLFPQMKLIKDTNGKPFVELLNQNRTKIYEDLQIKQIHLSISHDDATSIAFVILEK